MPVAAPLLLELLLLVLPLLLLVLLLLLLLLVLLPLLLLGGSTFDVGSLPPPQAERANTAMPVRQ